MTVKLLPRLSTLGVTRVLATAPATGPSPVDARLAISEGASMLSYAASGGTQSSKMAEEIAERLREIASRCGFPENASQTARARFDQEAAIYLGGHEDLATGEALRNDVWAHLASAGAPDVVSWRFSKLDSSRFAGGPRNAFQRLWLRGSTLDRGHDAPDRWALVKALSEDASVAIFERPSIAGNRALAQALAEEWVRTAHAIGRGSMEPVMRKAIKLVRLRNEIFDLPGLPAHELRELVSSCFDLAKS